MANNFSVEDALSSRKKRKEEERSLSVDKALADRKQRITSSIDSISSDINSRLNDSVRKYTDYENNYSSGNNSTMSDVLNNQRVQNVANQKAMQKVNAYRNYLDESAVNEALKRLGAIDSGYQNKVNEFAQTDYNGKIASIEDQLKNAKGSEKRELKKQKDALEMEARQKERTGRYNEYANLVGNGDFRTVSNNRNVEGQDRLGTYLKSLKVGRAMAFAEDGANYDGESWVQLMDEGYNSGWEQMNDTDISIYYYILNTQGSEAANKYLSDMEYELGKRRNEALGNSYDDASALKKIGMNAASVPANVFGGLSAFASDVNNFIRGNELNPYDREHELMNYASTVRGKTAAELDGYGEALQNKLGNSDALNNIQKVSGVIGNTASSVNFAGRDIANTFVDTSKAGGDGFGFGDAYQALMSGADSFVGAGLLGEGYTVAMGMGAASNTAKDLWEKGASDGQIAFGALTSGAAEIIFEKISLDHYLNADTPTSKAELVKQILSQAGVEASEEMFTEIANLITDAINMRSQSEWQQMFDAHDGSFAEKLAGAIEDTIGRVANAGIGGFVSGGVLGGLGSITNYHNVGKYGNEVYGDAQEDLVIEGLDSAEGTKSRQVAEEYAKKLDEGKRLNGQELVKLAEANQEAIDAENKAELAKEFGNTENDIRTALLDYGLSEKASATIISEAKDYKYGSKAYLNGLNLAYEYGRTNQQSKLGDIVMTDSTKNLLFTVGKENTANANRAMAILKKNNPHVAIEKNVAMNTLAPDVRAKAQASIAVAEAYGSASNVKFHAVQTVHKGNKLYAVIDGAEKEFSANGFFTRGNNVYFDVNAGDTFNGLGAYTIGHETGHFIAENNKEGFAKLSEAVIAQIDKMAELNPQKYQSFEKDLSDKLEQYKKLRDDGNKDYAGTDDELEAMAKEDVICDAISTFAADAETFKEFTDNIAKTDRSLWEKLKDVIGKMIKRLESALKSFRNDDGSFVDADQNSARAIQNLVDDEYKKLRSLYATAFAEASNSVATVNEELAEDGIIVNDNTNSASLESARFLLDDKQKEKVVKNLTARFGVTEKEAKSWLTAETSLASLILNPKYSAILDYEADPDEEAIKQNSDYPQGTVDFSTICAKRREFTNVMNSVMRNFPNHVFAATDLAKIRTIMQNEGMTIPCGICYVEDRRQLDTIVAQDFIDSLKLYREGSETRPNGQPFNTNQLKAFKLIDGDSYVPSVYELVTLEGKNALKAKDPNMAKAWNDFNNARGMQAVRQLTNEAEYKRQILKLSKSAVKSKNDRGGLRIYSFSDAEMFHLIDIIQVITDSSAVGLSIQGYTKVNEYAKAVKDTGEKLNRSLIPKGDLGYHMEGNKVVLDYDTVEGIDINSKDFFDNKDNPNIGNITIGVSDVQIRAAMVSDFVDQIIPFHTGQSKDVLGEKGIASWSNYKDSQTEKDIATGRTSKHQINIYTEVIQALEKDGVEVNKRSFVEKFLEVCKENGLTPRFAQFLNTDADGNYIYTEGYHKLLVDFKTFAQTEVGEYLPQMPVKPIFDDAYITGLLENYVDEQKTKDAKIAKQMPNVVKRITEEIIKPEQNVETFTDKKSGEEVKYSIRTEEPPKKTVKGYKVFFVKDGKLYPPMVANPNGADTPVGVWLNADIGVQAPDSKTGRKQVKAGGKGTQGGSGSLAFRPGWHLGETPLATQFDRTNPETGVRELFPENFVWAECDVAADYDYQEEAMSYGYNANGKFQHSLAGLPKLPVDGYYKYRTNPNPETVPWLITGAMKVNRLLSDAEVNAILAEKGLPPKQRQGGEKTLADLGLGQYESKNLYSIRKTVDGETFVEIDSNMKNLPDNADFKNEIANVIKNQYKNVITANGQTFKVNIVSNKEFRESVWAKGLRKKDSSAYYDKLRTFANLDELLESAKDWINEAPKHQRKDKIVSFGTANVLYRVNGNGYAAKIVVGVDMNANSLIYDIVDIKRKKINAISGNGANAPLSAKASINSKVSQNAKTVNKNSERDSSGKQLSKAQAEYFKDSKVRDENGNLQVVYHGSESFGFTVFDPAMSDDKRSLFFTNVKDMANTYVNDMDKIYSVYLNIKNPYVIDAAYNNYNRLLMPEDLEGKDDVIIKAYKYLNLAQRYDDAIDLGLLMESIGNLEGSVEYIFNEVDENSDGDELEVWDEGEREEMLSLARELDTMYEEWDEEAHLDEYGDGTSMESYLYDNSVKLRNTRYVAKYAKEHGYDGVIVNNVYDNGKFHMDTGIISVGSVYIAFDSNQVKNTDNENPTTDDDIRYSERDNIGYHAGDLGKAEPLSTQGYGRDTGHFGTGTYFVGNEAEINIGNYKERPHETVDFSKYHMYKVTDERTGRKLHDFLRGVDGFYDMNDGDIKSEDEWERRREKLSELVDDYYYNLTESVDVESIIDECIELFGTYDFGRMLSKVAKTEDGKPIQYDGDFYYFDGNDVVYIDKADVKNYGDIYDVADKLISDNRYAPRWVYAVERLNETIDNDSYSLFGISPSKVRSILKDVNKSISEDKTPTNVADSAATRFMKALGYEGIDVRGTDLDNTTYGSVIYDLKDEDLERKQKIGTARFSERDLSQDPRMLLSNALATTAQNDIERKYIEDYQSKIETINEEQKKLTEIKAELKNLSFATGKRDTERIKQLSAEATKINNRINIYDKQLLKLESTKALKDVVEREKVKARKLAEQHSREAFQRYRERRSDIDIRHKIKGIAEDLTKMLKNPTERRFVPINFVQGVIDVVNSLDPTGRTYYKSGTSDVDVARTNEMYDPESKAAEKFRTAKEALINLKLQYDSLKNVDNYDFSSEFNEEFSSHISELIEAVGDTPIREMNYDQLSDVYDILSDIQFMIKYATKQIGKEDAISNYQMGQKIIEEMDEVRKKKLTTGKVGDIFREWTLNPMRAVREMTGYNEDSALYSLFADLNEGLRNADKFRMETAKRFDELRDTKATKKVFDDAVQNASVEVIDTKNNKVKISKMQAMQAILTYEREIMNPNRRHLQSPVRFTDVALDVKGKYSDAFDNGHDVYVDESFIKRVNDVLTDWDKQYLAAARQFFNVDSKQAVNEVSMKTKHRLVATEKAYIPYYVNQDYISKESENVKFDATIEGMGMLKSVKNNAPQQLVIRGLNTVIQDHADKVAKVYGLTIPVRNWNKAFNMKQTQKDGGDTVKVAIRNSWHDGGLKLLDQAVADLQSSRKRDKAALFSGAKSAFVTSTLAGNLSVWLKQAASYPTAGAVLSTSSLTKAFKYFGKNMTDTYAEIDAHTPEHWKRRIGLSTQELGDMNQSKGWQNKLNEKLGVASPMNWIQAMDVKTTAVLWEASKLEAVKRGMKVDTEEYWNEVTKLYNKVIEDTQPMYDPLHRAEVTKNQLYSTFIMFQTQPLQNSGILREGAMKYKDYKNLYGKDSAEAKEAFGEFKKAVGSQMASHLTFTLFTLIGSMILHKMNRYRDDDDEVTAASLITEFTKQFGENFIGAILPIVGSYGISIAEKFIDGNRYDVISDPTVDKINTTIDNFVKLKKPSLGAFTNMATDIASYFGVPATNIMNIVNGARLHIEDIANGDFGSFEAGVDRSNKQDAHIMYNSYLAGDTAKMNRFKEDFIQEYLDKGKTEKEAKSQLRSTVTSNYKPLFLEAYNNKDTETMTKIRRFMNALNVYDDVVKTTQDWISKSK